jgi:predicted PurR-regulated permease PerM
MNFFSSIRTNILKISTLIFIIIAFLYILSPFFFPIILGGILALVFSPFVHFLMDKNMGRQKAVNILAIFLIVTGMIPFTLFLFKGASLINVFLSKQDIISELLIYKDNALNYIDSVAINLGINLDKIHQYIESSLNYIGSFLVNQLTSLFSSIPSVLMSMFITWLSVYFLLLAEEQIRRLFDRHFYFSPAIGNRFIMVLKSSAKEVFFSNVVTGVVQATIIATSSSLLGVADFFMVFFITFIASFIPVIGAAPIALIIAFISFAKGFAPAAITMLIISAITGVADNIIRPYLTSLGSVQINPFISFLSVLGGVMTLGLTGLFIGPLLASLFFGIIPIILEDYQ